MKPFHIYVSKVLSSLRHSEGLRWSKSAGLGTYTLYHIAHYKHDPALHICHKACMAGDVLLSDILEWLEQGTLPPEVLASSRPLPVLHTDVLMETQSLDCMRPMFSAWVASAIPSYGLTPPLLAQQAGLHELFIRRLIGPQMIDCKLTKAHAIAGCLGLRLSSVVRQLEYISELVYNQGGEDTSTARAYLREHAEQVWPLLREVPAKRRQRKQRN